MSSQLQFSFAPGALRVTLSDIVLSPGIGTYRIAFPTTHRATWLNDDENAVALITGTVWLDGHARPLIGQLHPRVIELRAFDATDDLTVDVDAEQLVGIDAARGDSDLTFRIDATATLLAPSAGVYPVVRTQGNLMIRGSEWIRQLDQNQIEVTVAIRVPIPLGAGSAPTSSSWSRTAQLLRRAREQFRDGDYRGAVIACRLVLESAEQIAPYTQRAKVHQINSKQRDLEQRWAAVFWEVKALTDPATHEDDNAQQFGWGRADTESILAAVAALVARTMAAPAPTMQPDTAPSVASAGPVGPAVPTTG